MKLYLEKIKLGLLGGGGLYSTEVAFLLLTQWPWIRYSAFTKIYFDVAEVYRWLWLEESGQRLENVDQTHLVLASGKLVQQKMLSWFS